jgi:hypothetical protein
MEKEYSLEQYVFIWGNGIVEEMVLVLHLN